MAVRAWSETTIPPVFGKEMDQRAQMADIRNTGISHFYYLKIGVFGPRGRVKRPVSLVGYVISF
jgi:hypothetical protein